MFLRLFQQYRQLEEKAIQLEAALREAQGQFARAQDAEFMWRERAQEAQAKLEEALRGQADALKLAFDAKGSGRNSSSSEPPQPLFGRQRMRNLIDQKNREFVAELKHRLMGPQEVSEDATD